MELEYRKEGDYYLPNLLPPDSPRVGKFGRMYLRHLREDTSVCWKTIRVWMFATQSQET